MFEGEAPVWISAESVEHLRDGVASPCVHVDPRLTIRSGTPAKVSSGCRTDVPAPILAGRTSAVPAGVRFFPLVAFTSLPAARRTCLRSSTAIGTTVATL